LLAGAPDAPISLDPKGTENLLLPERQFRIIEVLSKADKKVLEVNELSRQLGTDPSALMRDLAELEAKGLIRTSKRYIIKAKLTEEGEKFVKKGFPEERLLKKLLEVGEEVPLSTIFSQSFRERAELSTDEVKIAINHLIRLRAIRIERGSVKLASKEEIEGILARIRSEREGLRKLRDATLSQVDDTVQFFRRRKLIELREKTILEVGLTDKALEMLERGQIRSGIVVTRLTPELIVSGKWRSAIFKKFDLRVDVPTVYPSRKHPYMELLDDIREILASMGFEEVKGPHVELEFWNFDSLFQAQDHPAREIHDTFYLKFPKRGSVSDKDLLERVKRTHENGWITGSKGWGYKWSPEKALKLILRTQTTAVSMRVIYERGEGEYRCFSLDRVFRPETLDPTHSMEFYQLEGIIVGRRVTFRNLLWFFNEFAKKLGLGWVKIKPAYFPFTEPSVEGFIKHPKLGWIEVFPGGMFRPEVLYPLGVKNCNVAAWGIGIDRIAMAMLEIDDIRDLFSQRIDFLREKPVPIIRSLWR